MTKSMTRVEKEWRKESGNYDEFCQKNRNRFSISEWKEELEDLINHQGTEKNIILVSQIFYKKTFELWE